MKVKNTPAETTLTIESVIKNVIDVWDIHKLIRLKGLIERRLFEKLIAKKGAPDHAVGVAKVRTGRPDDDTGNVKTNEGG